LTAASHGASRDTLFHPPQQHIEDRRQEQAEEGDAEHPGEHRNAHGVTDLGAGTGEDDQRHDAHDEGEGGRQDRPQPRRLLSLSTAVDGFGSTRLTAAHS